VDRLKGETAFLRGEGSNNAASREAMDAETEALREEVVRSTLCQSSDFWCWRTGEQAVSHAWISVAQQIGFVVVHYLLICCIHVQHDRELFQPGFETVENDCNCVPRQQLQPGRGRWKVQISYQVSWI